MMATTLISFSLGSIISGALIILQDSIQPEETSQQEADELYCGDRNTTSHCRVEDLRLLSDKLSVLL